MDKVKERFTTTQRLLNEVVEELRISNHLNDNKDKKLEKILKHHHKTYQMWMRAKKREAVTTVILAVLTTILAVFTAILGAAATLGIIKAHDLILIKERALQVFTGLV